MQVPTLTQGVDPDAGVDRLVSKSQFIVFIVTKKAIQTKAKTITGRGGGLHTQRGRT